VGSYWIVVSIGLTQVGSHGVMECQVDVKLFQLAALKKGKLARERTVRFVQKCFESTMILFVT